MTNKDLLAIAEHQFLGGIPHGFRVNWLFLSAEALSWFAYADVLEHELLERAEAWMTLNTADLRKALAPALSHAQQAAEGEFVPFVHGMGDPRYRFRLETLFEWIEGCIPSELAPQPCAIGSPEVKAEHHVESKRKHETTCGPRNRVAEGRYKQKRLEYLAGSVAVANRWETIGISHAIYYRCKSLGTI